jgi:hypothetical protein
MPWRRLFGEKFDELLMHAMTNMLAVAQAILNEGDVDIGEEDQVIMAFRRDRIDGGGPFTKIASMPNACGKRGGVADHHPIGQAGSGVLHFARSKQLRSP